MRPSHGRRAAVRVAALLNSTRPQWRHTGHEIGLRYVDFFEQDSAAAKACVVARFKTRPPPTAPYTTPVTPSPAPGGVVAGPTRTADYGCPAPNPRTRRAEPRL